MHHDFFYAAETALRSNSGMHCLVDEQGKQKEIGYHTTSGIRLSHLDLGI